MTKPPSGLTRQTLTLITVTSLLQITALRKQAQCQFQAHEFAAALQTYQRALALAPDHPGVQQGMARCQQLLEKQKDADALLRGAEELLADGSAAAALSKVEAVLVDIPTMERALALRARCQAAMQAAAQPVAVDATNQAAVQQAAQAAVGNIMSELDLSGKGTLNYRMFVSWWQKKLKHHGAGAYDTQRLPQGRQSSQPLILLCERALGAEQLPAH